MKKLLLILVSLLGMLLVLAGCGGSTSTTTSNTTPTPTTSAATVTPTQTGTVIANKGVNPFCVSTHLDSSALTTTDRSRQFDLMKTAGIGTVRVEIERSRVNPSKGVWNFSRYDEIFNLADSKGIRYIALLDATDSPDWLYPSNNNPYDWELLQQPNDYGDFVAAVAGRYGSRVAFYELANEPDLVGKPHLGVQATAARFVALLKAGYQAIKNVRAGLQVVSGGVSNADPIPFVQAMYNSGAHGFFDGFGFHPYSQPNPPSFANLVTIQGIMASNGDGGKKVIVTEVGWSTGTSNESVSEQTQAQYLTAFYQALGAHNVPVACWYDFKNDGNDLSNSEDNFGLVRSDYSLKPSYSAMQSIASK